MVIVFENDHYRANDEASNAREQLQRPFGFAGGSGAVFVPQVEAYEEDISNLIFIDTSLTFGAFSSVVVVWAVSLPGTAGHRPQCASAVGLCHYPSSLVACRHSPSTSLGPRAACSPQSESSQLHGPVPRALPLVCRRLLIDTSLRR